MKKFFAVLLAAALFSGICGCSAARALFPPDEPEPPVDATNQKSVSDDIIQLDESRPQFRIGLLTDTQYQSEEIYNCAQNIAKKYGDMIALASYPDDFSQNVQGTVDAALELASDPLVRAIVFIQGITGASQAVDAVRETRPDMLFIVGMPAEPPNEIAMKADFVLQTDHLAIGRQLPDNAKRMGAKTLVYYTFQRHMDSQTFAGKYRMAELECAALGMTIVKKTIPDPTVSGIDAASAFVESDMEQQIAQYGRQTAFYCTNCAMQKVLIQKALETGAIFVLQCCPSPYHGYPEALGIDEEGHWDDALYMIKQIKTKISNAGEGSKFGTWPVPVNMLILQSGVEYSIKYCRGETNGRFDRAAMESIIKKIAADYGSECTIALDKLNGVTFPNDLLIMCDYLTF